MKHDTLALKQKKVAMKHNTFVLKQNTLAMEQNKVAMKHNTFVLKQNNVAMKQYKVALEQISVASNVKRGDTPPPSRLISWQSLMRDEFGSDKSPARRRLMFC